MGVASGQQAAQATYERVGNGAFDAHRIELDNKIKKRFEQATISKAVHQLTLSLKLCFE